ncbi:MAG: CHAT domain-containing protein, partial [Chitinophagaceae bacterium]
AVQQQEEQLMAAIRVSLQSGRNETDGIQRYIIAEKNWKAFQEMLRQQYPRYYTMRYAAMKDRKLNELTAQVPEGVTAVRYLFINNNFFALVADKNKHAWIPLQAAQAPEWIRRLSEPGLSASTTNELCFSLYKALWQPLEKQITGKRVIIIPDGPLYYLSFDMLTKHPGTTLPDLISNSLLSSYAISYHYSLLALGTPAKPRKKNGNFAAFVPAFSDDVKKEYMTALQADTLRADNEYLSLLPLPFSVDLARNMQRKMGGVLFEGNESTPFAFRSNAGNKSIIHIGTHAEANNLHPEYSRLIFAKDFAHAADSNAVFLYDIYNYDLGSDLTVLTACDTGRPGLNDGEGMISMAHAF